MSFYGEYHKKENSKLDPDYVGQLKIILVGERQVGKTNILSRYVNAIFKTDTISTSSPSFYPKFLTIDDDTYKLNLWDTAGQEIYHSLTKIFLQKVNIAILVYAINDRNSFENLDFWYNTVKECSEDVRFCVCGNKSDLIDEIFIEHEEGKKYAESIDAPFYITSAKDLNDNNINIMFEEIIKQYIKENKFKIIDKTSSFTMSSLSKSTTLTKDSDYAKSKRKCCSGSKKYY